MTCERRGLERSCSLRPGFSELQRAFHVVVGAPVQRTPSPDQGSLDRCEGMAPPVYPFRYDLRATQRIADKPGRRTRGPMLRHELKRGPRVPTRSVLICIVQYCPGVIPK